MRQRGFTLFELACVMAIMGVIASVSVMGLSAYLRRGRAEEAYVHLHTIADMQRAHPGGPIACAGSPPAVPKAAPASWVASPGFAALGFSPGAQTRFSYRVEVPGPDGAAFVVRALGDLDGDGETSLYELRADRADIRVERGLE